MFHINGLRASSAVISQQVHKHMHPKNQIQLMYPKTDLDRLIVLCKS